jgi:hypothetical protein
MQFSETSAETIPRVKKGRHQINGASHDPLTFGIIGDVLEGELASGLELHVVSIHKLAAPDLRALDGCTRRSALADFNITACNDLDQPRQESKATTLFAHACTLFPTSGGACCTLVSSMIAHTLVDPDIADLTFAMVWAWYCTAQPQGVRGRGK